MTFHIHPDHIKIWSKSDTWAEKQWWKEIEKDKRKQKHSSHEIEDDFSWQHCNEQKNIEWKQNKNVNRTSTRVSLTIFNRFIGYIKVVSTFFLQHSVSQNLKVNQQPANFPEGSTDWNVDVFFSSSVIPVFFFFERKHDSQCAQEQNANGAKETELSGIVS